MADPKIAAVEVFVTCPAGTNYVVVRVQTDQDGLYGYGSGKFLGGEHALAALIEHTLAPRLIGADPDRLEDIWQVLRRSMFWRTGPLLKAAMGAIDVALWDIKGRRAGLPLYSLLGGRTRDRVLCYGHASGEDIQSTVEDAQRLRQLGYRAIRAQVGTPGYVEGSYGAGGGMAFDTDPRAERVWEPTPYMRVVPRLFAELREALGDGVELLHDVHDRLTPQQAAQLGRELEPFHLFYLEDPIPVEGAELGLRLMRQLTTTPLAIGERIFSLWDCLPLLSGQLIDFIRVGLGMCGGITELRKIATVAEAFGVRTAFQGPTDSGPCAFAAMVHLDLAIPNFGIQERADFPDGVYEVFGGLPTYRDGYLEVGAAPGLGVEFDARAAARYPHRQRWEPLVRRLDGSLVEP
jgi:mannonate dehydratase